MAAAVPALALALAWERRLARRGGEPLLDLPLFRDRAFSAGLGVNFALVFFFGSFMFVLTLLLQAGLGQSPLHAGLEAGPLAFTFTMMSILGPRLSARFGARSITFGAGLAALGTIALAITGVRYGGDLTGWDLVPATALIGLGQGMALPSLIGAAMLTCRRNGPGRRPGYSRPRSSSARPAAWRSSGRCSTAGWGDVPSRGGSVSAMVLAMVIDAVIVLAAAGLTLLLPRRPTGRQTAIPRERAEAERAAEYTEAVH